MKKMPFYLHILIKGKSIRLFFDFLCKSLENFVKQNIKIFV